MKEQIATELFGRGRRLNCAQAILTAFRDEFDVTAADIAAAAADGHGKADQGRCGALHAGLQLLRDRPDLVARLEREFVAQAAAARCRDIRKGRLASCTECVAIVARLLERYLAEDT